MLRRFDAAGAFFFGGDAAFAAFFFGRRFLFFDFFFRRRFFFFFLPFDEEPEDFCAGLVRFPPGACGF